jgi:hypothetical protein
MVIFGTSTLERFVNIFASAKKHEDIACQLLKIACIFEF